MRDKQQGRQTFSYLVRLWKEEDEADTPQRLRGYIRNLRTGKERYLGDPASIADYLVSDARDGEISEVRDEGSPDETRKADAG